MRLLTLLLTISALMLVACSTKPSSPAAYPELPAVPQGTESPAESTLPVELPQLADQLPGLAILDAIPVDPHRSGTAASVQTVMGNQFLSKSDNAQENAGEEHVLLDADPDNISWAIYRFSGLEELTGESLLAIETDPLGEGDLLVGLSDYSSGRWQFTELPYVSSDNTLQLPLADAEDFISGNGNLHLACIARAFLEMEIDAVHLYQELIPEVPLELQATDDLPDRIRIGWSQVAGVSGYRLYSNSGLSWELLIELEGAGNTAYDFIAEGSGEPTMDQTYSFRVSTVYDGSIESPGFSPTDTGLRTLPQVQNFTATDGALHDAIEFEWDLLPDVDIYRIYYRETPGEGDWEFIAYVDEDGPPTFPVRAHTDSLPPGLEADHAHVYEYYVIGTFEGGVNGGPPSEPDTGYRKLATPPDQNATYNEYVNLFFIRATAVPGATQYQFFLKAPGDLDFSHFVTLGGTSMGIATDVEGDYELYVLAANEEAVSDPPAETQTASPIVFTESTLKGLGPVIPDIRAERVDGAVVVAYTDAQSDDVVVVNAKKDIPAGIADWNFSATGIGKSAGTVSLIQLDGSPAVAFQGADDIHYAYTKDHASAGTKDWTSFVIDSSGSSDFAPSLIEVDQRPALSFISDSDGLGLYYAIADSMFPADETEFKIGKILNKTSEWEIQHMALLGGLPAIVHTSSGQADVDFSIATIPDPLQDTDWLTSSFPASGTVTEARLVDNGGYPYCTLSRILYAPDPYLAPFFHHSVTKLPVATDWVVTGDKYSAGFDRGSSLDMKLINERLYCCYYRDSQQEVGLAVARVEHPQTMDDWVFSSIPSANDRGASCAIVENGGLFALLVYDSDDEEIVFMQGS